MSQNLFRLLASRQPRSAALLASKACVSTLFWPSDLPVALVTSTRPATFNIQHPRFFTSSRSLLKSGATSSFDDFDEDVEEDNEDDKDEGKAEFLSTKNPHWVQAGLDADVIKKLSKNGITEFTPVQAEAFVPVLAGQDVMGRSRTGTGKTLAFGLPAMTRLVNLTVEKGTRTESGRMTKGRKPSMVVLCPTRELARQVADELTLYADVLDLDVTCFHGGVSYNPQRDALYGGLDILVGTPGRINDHLEQGTLSLAECNIAVLDEADQMLDMGFSEQVEAILDRVGKANAVKSQLLLFSATTPDWVTNVAKRYQKNVFSIDSTGTEGGARVAKTVRHMAVEIPRADLKHTFLEDIINNELGGKDGKILIFTETKREADALAMNNALKSLSARSLHGDHSQGTRDYTLDQFRAGKFRVLIATDVAARGIDIKDVDLVVQLSPPSSADTYVHRSGRTGRAGAKGASILLFTRAQRNDIRFIERDLGHGFQFEIKPPPSEEEIVAVIVKKSVEMIKTVTSKSAAMYKETADQLVAETTNPADLVARCLAAMNKRPDRPEYSAGVSEDRPNQGRGYEQNSSRFGGGFGGRGQKSIGSRDSNYGSNSRSSYGGGSRGGSSYGGGSRGGDNFGSRYNSPKSESPYQGRGGTRTRNSRGFGNSASPYDF